MIHQVLLGVLLYCGMANNNILLSYISSCIYAFPVNIQEPRYELQTQWSERLINLAVEKVATSTTGGKLYWCFFIETGNL